MTYPPGYAPTITRLDPDGLTLDAVRSWVEDMTAAGARGDTPVLALTIPTPPGLGFPSGQQLLASISGRARPGAHGDTAGPE